MGPYKPLLLGWWVYPLLYGNNGSLDPGTCIFSSSTKQFLSWTHQVTCWHLPQSVGRRHRRIKPMKDMKATLDRRVFGALNMKMNGAATPKDWPLEWEKMVPNLWFFWHPKFEQWTKMLATWLTRRFENPDYTLFNIDTYNQAFQKVSLF